MNKTKIIPLILFLLVTIVLAAIFFWDHRSPKNLKVPGQIIESPSAQNYGNFGE